MPQGHQRIYTGCPAGRQVTRRERDGPTRAAARRREIAIWLAFGPVRNRFDALNRAEVPPVETIRAGSKPETRRSEAMKTINELALAVFAMPMAPAFAVAAGMAEKEQGCGAEG